MNNLNAKGPLFRSPLLCSILSLVSCGDAGRESEAALIQRAQAIHDGVITLDTHHDISPANFVEDRNYTMDLDTQVNLPKMEAGGLDVSWMVVFVGQGPLTEEGYAQANRAAMDKFNAIHWLAEEKAPDQIEIAYTSDDVRRIWASGKKVAMIAIENAYQVGLDLSNIQKFQELGGRYMSLAHNGHSQFGDSNTGERDDLWLHHGLSELGREALAESGGPRGDEPGGHHGRHLPPVQRSHHGDVRADEGARDRLPFVSAGHERRQPQSR